MDELLDRIDAVIREAEIDELVDWQLRYAETRGITRPMRMQFWRPGMRYPIPRSSAGAWIIDQLHEADHPARRALARLR